MRISNQFLLALLSFSLLSLWSCKQERAIEPQEKQSDDQFQTVVLDTEADQELYAQLTKAHQERLAGLGLELRGCQNVVRVPNDYPTIQEAIDAVCEGGKVFVHEGVYNEAVTVDKPGLDIKANGEVTVNGSFTLLPGADNVSLQQFNVVLPASSGIAILGVGITGGQIKLNTVSGSNQGIRLSNSSGVSISHNTVTGSDWGILLVASLDGNSSCNGNAIAHNTITETATSSPIHLQGDCDNNMIRNNTVTLKTNINPNVQINAGITLYSFSGIGVTCDNNTVRNNNVFENECVGIWLIDGGANNTIGPDNTFNSNGTYGIWLHPPTQDNFVFENTALDNPLCDIVNQGTNNTFVDNIADCTIGL